MKKKEEKKRGGARPGAGRKPVTAPMVPVTIYVPEPEVQNWGGKEAMKEKLTAIVSAGPLLLHPSQRALLSSAPKTKAAKDRERDEILSQVNPPLTEEFKKTFPPSDDDIKSAGIQKHEKPFAPETNKILDQIAAIRAEKIPKERDTTYGRRAWQLDQQKRIQELQAKLK